MATELPPVYLAGPDGFTPAGLDWHRRVLMPAMRETGLEPLSPWDLPDIELATAEAIGAANTALIDRCRGVLAVLDGPDVDSGTAAEIGYAAKAGLIVVGLRTDSRRTGDVDGVTVNLQVEYFIRLSGGSVHSRLESALVELSDLLGASSDALQ